MKKVLAIFLAIAVMSAGMGTVAADPAPAPAPQQGQLSNFMKTSTYDQAFTDIDGHWAEAHVASAYEYGIISGIGGGRYDPEGHLTVAQAIAIAARLHMRYQYADAGQSVMDGYAAAAASDHWAAPFLAYAVGEGLITDTWGGMLDQPVTRAETVRIWSLLQPDDLVRINSVNSLPDVSPSTPYFAEITLFYEAGIVQGSTVNGVPNSFRPSGTLSRAEAATMFMLFVEADQRITGRTYGEKTVLTLAGTGTSGFADDALAVASFTLPYGLAAGSKGGIVVFDTYNNALRRMDHSSVTTLAGQWIKEGENRFSSGYYKDGLRSEALFNHPTDGVYNAQGDLFVCDSESDVIRLIRDDRVYTFAGTKQGYADGTGSAAQFHTPMAIAIDKSGTLYVTDTINHCIRKIDANGTVTTIAGVPGRGGYENGSAAASLFRNPSGIAVSEDGSVIYVADTGNHRIRVIEKGSVTTLSGITTEVDADGDPLGGYQDGAAGEAMFHLPKGLTLAEDILFVADSGNNAIRAVNRNGHVFTAAGTGEPGDRDGGMLTAAFNQPVGVLWHEGVLYIADTTNNKIKTLAVNIAAFRGTEA